MEWLSSVIESTDSGWKILAIFLVGIYVLLWKFGGELLKLARENNTVAKQAHTVAKTASKGVDDVRDEARKITSSITTNHGSKNLGDAIDRLTEWMLVHMHEQRSTDATLAELRAELVLQAADSTVDMERVRSALTSLDERISCVESKQ